MDSLITLQCALTRSDPLGDLAHLSQNPFVRSARVTDELQERRMPRRSRAWCCYRRLGPTLLRSRAITGQCNNTAAGPALTACPMTLTSSWIDADKFLDRR
jgi:hypothetical protein